MTEPGLDQVPIHISTSTPAQSSRPSCSCRLWSLPLTAIGRLAVVLTAKQPAHGLDRNGLHGGRDMRVAIQGDADLAEQVAYDLGECLAQQQRGAAMTQLRKRMRQASPSKQRNEPPLPQIVRSSGPPRVLGKDQAVLLPPCPAAPACLADVVCAPRPALRTAALWRPSSRRQRHQGNRGIGLILLSSGANALAGCPQKLGRRSAAGGPHSSEAPERLGCTMTDLRLQPNLGAAKGAATPSVDRRVAPHRREQLRALEIGEVLVQQVAVRPAP
jgi:hypothetical protein